MDGDSDCLMNHNNVNWETAVTFTNAVLAKKEKKTYILQGTLVWSMKEAEKWVRDMTSRMQS